MKRALRVNLPPPKPLLIFDGDCNFCTLWIRRWRQLTGEAVDYLPSQDPKIAAQFPEIPRENFAASIQLIETDGEVFSGAQAVFRALAKNPKIKWPLRVYEKFPAVAKITERAYRCVAGHRTFFSALTKFFWGRHVERPNYLLTRGIFLRALGLIYLVAFISLWTQISGLIGPDGILPADKFISAARQQCAAQNIGWERYYLLPTLSWFNASDHFLNLQCAAGTFFSILLIIGLAPAPCLFLLWLLYLSLTVIGRVFFGFQWDNLLLEAGLLAIFFAPLKFFPRAREAPPSKIILWLLRLLLFKLMFSSGCVKWLSGDVNWHNLGALKFHYQTQPLPTWIGWYAAQLPFALQKFSCFLVLLTEIGAPFLMFGPRRIRFFGGGAIIFLQVLILLTGNYTFFNFLTIALCWLLLDDFAFQKFLPRRLHNFYARDDQFSRQFRRPRFITIPLAIVVLSVSIFQIISMFGVQSRWLRPLAKMDEKLQPLRSINGYGLFAVMTTTRNEIIVEGSNDGTNWLAYEFNYKPGDVSQRPRFIEPFQPRLDWQMWFAALGNYQQNPWFISFCQRLLQGSPPVLALLGKNPFPQSPPKFIRAEFYQYEFTTATERRATGAWWKRERAGDYLPAISLADLQKN